MALLWRTLSRVEELRAATEQLRTNRIAPSFVLMAEYLGYPPTNLPPFTIVGLAFLSLGFGLGFLDIPLVYRLRVALVEITLFVLSAVIVRVRIEQDDLLGLWVPPHTCSFVLGLLLALSAKGDLRSGACGACRPGVGERRVLLQQSAELVVEPPHLRERANRQACRQASRLLALLVAIMVYPLAHELAVLESQQGAPVYSLASVL